MIFKSVPEVNFTQQLVKGLGRTNCYYAKDQVKTIKSGGPFKLDPNKDWA